MDHGLKIKEFNVIYSPPDTEMEPSDKLHIEICQNVDSALPESEIKDMVHKELKNLGEIKLNHILYSEHFSNEILKEHVESILCSSDQQESHAKVEDARLLFHVYVLTQGDVAVEIMQYDIEELAVASQWILPNKEFHYLWENLHYDGDIKKNLLHFAESAMIFSTHNVNPNIISWNKMILLYGSPGNGKTSLCKALAQKMIIRMRNYYTHGELLEINSHSLFSKWFSESGKLVMKLFEEIRLLCENRNALICVLIDEVESLAHARKSCINGLEPTDSIRVVNALLTQLDQLKRYSNVMIFTTSNMTEAIDLAFVDRADIKQFIGHPSQQAIYKIYKSCLDELMKTGLVESETIYDLAYLESIDYEENSDSKNSIKLYRLCRESIGLSGRMLRKIAFLAHAFHIQGEKTTLSRFLNAMQLTIQKQIEDKHQE